MCAVHVLHGYVLHACMYVLHARMCPACMCPDACQHYLASMSSCMQVLTLQTKLEKAMQAQVDELDKIEKLRKGGGSADNKDYEAALAELAALKRKLQEIEADKTGGKAEGVIDDGQDEWGREMPEQAGVRWDTSGTVQSCRERHTHSR